VNMVMNTLVQWRAVVQMVMIAPDRFKWPRCLKHEISAVWLLDCGFESRRERGCLSLVSVVCCQVEVSAPGCSRFRSSPIECGGVCL
jgi:hypothetical protein